MIEVLDGGLSTTVQDDGRYGQYHIGVPPSGAMDQFAHSVANYLVGNDEEHATLEMTYKGCELRFEEDTVIALTGAEMTGTLGGEPLPMWEAVAVEAGDELELQFAVSGARSYLAVAGGVDVEPVMGSRSTYALIGIGGHEGRTLEAGDTLAVGEPASNATDYVGTRVPDDHIPTYDDDDATIRIVIGLCDYRLTDESKERLTAEKWKVAADADRVGYRLTGPELDFVPREQPFGAGTDPTNVVDLGYPVGSIQIPQQPIVVMRDAVTGGGYATVATVISADRGKLSQRRTHQAVYFEDVSVDEALAARKEQHALLDEIKAAVTPS
ncbi:biotin-dependent carboxyltransferase family protein [Haladaptatus sp. YSMS36]|uniref:5-oxoprolinase subunit C family protein n=1 Tax=Haladaptatus sp. YSMS36 TaxID=3033384 RepID=UPI0023E7A188|nr:biotin-dependent carboxyltransferase family protein [Haladaptatus sp. YSMS36]